MNKKPLKTAVIVKNDLNLTRMVQVTCFVFCFISYFQCLGQTENKTERYTYNTASYSGTGKSYMGREIAHVMGFQGMEWLERPEREAEESVGTLLQNMQIGMEDTIADIGAGSGYHTFKMAEIASKGLIYGVDIQEEMLFVMDARKESQELKNVTVILGGEQHVNLPENSIDKVLMVDVYHEFSYPFEMITAIKKALRPAGKIYLIEYRGEDPNVPIKKLHKMTEAQAIMELKASGFTLLENIDNLPWQHCMVFGLE